MEWLRQTWRKLKGDIPWSPGMMAIYVALFVHLAVQGMAMVRGNDYATGESPSSARRLGAVEAAAPLWVWGTLFTLAASLGFVAMAWRWTSGVIISHSLGAGLYAAISVGIVIDVADRTEGLRGAVHPILIIPAISLIACIVAAVKLRGISIAVAVAMAVSFALGLVSIELDGLRNATVLMGTAIVHGILAVGVAQKLAQDEIKQKMLEVDG